MANNRFTQLERAVQTTIHPTGAPGIPASRSLPSAETSYDVAVSDADSVLTSPFKPGLTRQMWQTPLNAIRSQVVSIKQSAEIVSGSAPGAFNAGLINSPTTSLSTLSVIPDMNVSLLTTNQVSVNMQGSFLGPTSATLSFALYRDAVQLDRVYPVVPPATGQPFLFHLSALDNPPPGTHSYSAQWSTSAGTATAAGYSRSISALNQKPA